MLSKAKFDSITDQINRYRDQMYHLDEELDEFHNLNPELKPTQYMKHPTYKKIKADMRRLDDMITPLQEKLDSHNEEVWLNEQKEIWR